jgi:glycosyltransferase involved in cell wall biosynthesis
MRILHLEASSGWGGQEIRILKEAEGMRARGHEVFFAVMKGGSLVERACKAGFTVVEVNFHKSAWIFTFFQLIRWMRCHRIDLVNTHSSLDSWIGAIAARTVGIPIVRTRHLSTPIKKGWNSRLLYGRLADFVVTTCSGIIPMICDQSGKKRSECRSIATGVDPHHVVVKEGAAQQFRSDWDIAPTDFLVGTACFMRSWKGIDDFLQAASLLREVPGIRWVIIGGGHAQKYREKSKELQLDGIVHFTGHLENPFPALAALDLFALLSTAHEGISQAILQAAYLEKPLLATAVGGLAEVCLDQITGLQVPPFSCEQVAAAVMKLKENLHFRQEAGRNGKRLVLERFTWVSTVDQMEAVYREILSDCI